jgi:acyl-CoA thioesterase I
MRTRSVGAAAIRFAVAAIVVTLIVFSTPSLPSRAQDSGVLIVAGDSIAAGIGSSLPRTRGYAALVAGWLRESNVGSIVLENGAIPGETAESFLTGGQLDRVIESIDGAAGAGLPVRAIVLSLGGNEMLRLQPIGLAGRQEGLDQFSVDYRAALDAVRNAAGPDVPVVVTTYYDLTDGNVDAAYTDAWWIRQFNEAIRDAASAIGASVADVEFAFDGSAPDYTHYPFDVHPNNAGHEAIARVVATALGVSEDAPVIEVVSDVSVTRETPTLKLRVSSVFGIASVAVTSDDVSVLGPFDDGDGEYMALLAFGGGESGPAIITISAVNVLGHETATEVTIVRADGQEVSR